MPPELCRFGVAYGLTENVDDDCDDAPGAVLELFTVTVNVPEERGVNRVEVIRVPGNGGPGFS